jgi:hypothetical protein
MLPFLHRFTSLSHNHFAWNCLESIQNAKGDHSLSDYVIHSTHSRFHDGLKPDGTGSPPQSFAVFFHPSDLHVKPSIRK